jgi:ABC-type bacteriocin/lantibiotic exporter with double-glycine peptidase domain|tara:strand:- start:10579 stop:12402 length:1824 start_codon:yes stop_codon:yes gene_type:complete
MDMETWKKAWSLLSTREKRSAWLVLIIVIFSAISSALMIGSVLPFLSVLADPGRIHTVPALTVVFEAFAFDSEYSFLVGLGLATLLMIVFTSFMQILKTWSVARFSMMRIHSISHRLMESYLCQSYEFFLNRHSGQMGTQILAETQQLVMQFLRPAAEAIAAVFTIIAILGLLLFVEPAVTLLAFSIVGSVYIIIFWMCRRALKRLGRERLETNSARFRITHEVLGGIKDIKLLGREASYLARFASPSRTMAAAIATIEVVSLIPKFALEAIAYGGIILLCLVIIDPQNLTSNAVLGGLLPLLGLFAFSGQRLMPELQKLYQSFTKIQAGAAAVDALYEDLINLVGSETLPRSIPIGTGLKKSLELKNVSYHYPDADYAGVKSVDLQLSAGEKIGVVGGTGAGKTTLADLILGLLSPSSGNIVVDGEPITLRNLRAWQQSVGYVPQDIFLTDASVAENIALGTPLDEIDQSRVENAARIAQLDKFIQSELPEGYNALIGERGVRLSGGQRQRIGIARALYHDADLIVFDEATSALDNLTEREVMSAIDALPDEKTVVMIAHRLSTVQRCDRIVVMEHGHVVGCGSWDELMVSNLAFQRIAQANKSAK